MTITASATARLATFLRYNALAIEILNDFNRIYGSTFFAFLWFAYPM